MPGGYLYGWDAVNSKWVKVICNADGELDVDATALFEDTPTDGELEKAPTSNWAYDHKADVDAHHVKYTDDDSRAAVGNQFNNLGWMIKDLYCRHFKIREVNWFQVISSSTDTKWVYLVAGANAKELKLVGWEEGVGYGSAEFLVYNGAAYVKFIHENSFQTTLALYLEEAPANGVVNKAPTSNWAYDHENDVDAHHAKYTDAEAQAACNLDGNLYLTIPGIAFSAYRANVDNYLKHPNGSGEAWNDDVNVVCACVLPDGATVTAVKVDGNAGAASQTWTLNRVALADQALTAMASATVQTEDTTISVATIDNSLYCYVINVPLLATNDKIYYARITYTL